MTQSRSGIEHEARCMRNEEHKHTPHPPQEGSQDLDDGHVQVILFNTLKLVT